MKILLITLLLTLDVSFYFSQHFLGLEAQLYPTGYIIAAEYRKSLNRNASIQLGVGLNVFDHKDFPKQAGINDHNMEEGYGYGLRMAYMRSFYKSLYIGAQTDLWYNMVDWNDIDCNGSNCDFNIANGHSNVLVVQPTINIGAEININAKKRVLIVPEMSLGYEWNAIVDGEQTGYGFIALAGISVFYDYLPRDSKHIILFPLF